MHIKQNKIIVNKRIITNKKTAPKNRLNKEDKLVCAVINKFSLHLSL